ncbi:hypothetical protein H6785_03145 [Candidatus Nomurabacteria bacterium]|nr:hypothetical protein [Candidatus Kaiserbacteria bacterium]MCB9815543.1 hypothetical protein [Candidatus Nomurabacteria bacterium]
MNTSYKIPFGTEWYENWLNQAVEEISKISKTSTKVRLVFNKNALRLALPNGRIGMFGDIELFTPTVNQLPIDAEWNYFWTQQPDELDFDVLNINSPFDEEKLVLFLRKLRLTDFRPNEFSFFILINSD